MALTDRRAAPNGLPMISFGPVDYVPGTPASLYADRLSKALRVVDHFFGDYGEAKQTAFMRLIGLQKPAHIWTASALDRCILLAFIYPVVAILFIWVNSGQSGPAEYVLGLSPNRSGLTRGLVAAATVASVFCYVQSRGAATNLRSAGDRRSAWVTFIGWFGAAVAFAFVVDLLLTKDNIGAVAGSVALASSVIGAAAGDTFLAVGSALGGGIIATLAVGVSYRLASITSATAIACVGILLATAGLKLPKPSGILLLTFSTSAIVACLVGATLLSASTLWPLIGPLLLFFGLLSALNAPFNWFSLGVTRGLLRRGIESNDWWPYFYALLDATVAVFVIILLTFVLVLAVQAFDLLAVVGGGTGKVVLPLIGQANGNVEPLLDGIANNPAAPQYWWLYGLLLFALVPSIANLVIGGLSLSRGIPLITNYVRQQMSERPNANRTWIALLLTAQDLFGVVAGVGVQAILIFFMLGSLLPRLGTSVFALDRWLVDLHLPSLFMSLVTN